MSKAAKAEPEAEKEGAAPTPKAASPLPALIVAIVVLPAISYATTEFLLLPKLKAMISQEAVKTAAKTEKKGEGKTASAAAHGEAKAHGDSKGHGEKGKEGESAEGSYDFENVVVNLSGSMGTRYLKTSFTVNGGPDIKTIITDNKKQLLDVTINVLSSRSLADLEAPGAKNIVRNDLMANLNQALKSDVVEQIYFTEFVIQ